MQMSDDSLINWERQYAQSLSQLRRDYIDKINSLRRLVRWEFPYEFWVTLKVSCNTCNVIHMETLQSARKGTTPALLGYSDMRRNFIIIMEKYAMT